MKKNMIFPIAIALSLTLTACGGSAPEAQSERAETNQAWADEKYDALLENYGVKSQSELLTQNPASVQSYLVSAESPSSGTVVFTAQLTEADVDKAEVEQAAMAVLNLVGFSDETVDRVEVVTADSSVRGVANRNDSPMLNK